MRVESDLHLADELSEGLAHLRAEATSGDVERSEKIAARLSEIITEHGDFVDKDDFYQQIDHYRLLATKSSLNTMLEDALLAARNVNTSEMSRILGRAEQRIVDLTTLGADLEYQSHVAQRLALIKTTVHEVGSEKAANGGAAPSNERRRARRLSGNHVVATIAGVSYRCIDWSARGLLVDGFDSDVRINDRLRVRVEAPGFPGGGQLTATIIRYDADRKHLALDFGDVSRVMLLLIKVLEDAENKSAQTIRRDDRVCLDQVNRNSPSA